MTALATMPCCDLHNQHCEPPADLCCMRCTEASHPDHRRGEICVLASMDRRTQGIEVQP